MLNDVWASPVPGMKEYRFVFSVAEYPGTQVVEFIFDSQSENSPNVVILMHM
jgi:hypothetical protein